MTNIYKVTNIQCSVSKYILKISEINFEKVNSAPKQPADSVN